MARARRRVERGERRRSPGLCASTTQHSLNSRLPPSLPPPPPRISMPKPAASRRKRPTPEGAREIYDRLAEHYPDAKCALDYRTPYQLLVATILSAQCTDKRVNIVTPALFKRYRTPAAMADANPEELEEMI